jgi:enamine deaminase RidA (YjgF/YER057c/UK114 family)
VNRIFRIAFVAPVLLCCFLPASVPAQQKKKKSGSDDAGMVLPPIITEDKKKKKKEGTQSLPPPVEPPSAVMADTDRISFQVSPLSNKGLLSQQTRDALKTMLRTNRGATIVNLRAFVAGSGDLRRIGEIVAEVFTDKHLPLPALSVIQAGALPMEGAQVVIESTMLERKPVNPNGIAFLSGQAGPGVSQSLDKLKSALRSAGMEPADLLRATCFVSSLDDPAGTGSLMSASFPSAAINYVQMQREPVNPASECEAVGRLHAASTQDVRFVNPPELDKSPNYSQVVLVTTPKLVITGTQLAFGIQENDVKLAFERLQRALAQFKAGFQRVAMSHVYVTSTSMTEKVRAVRARFYNAETPPASTLLPFEGLPSLDATFGVDVIAVPADATASVPPR